MDDEDIKVPAAFEALYRRGGPFATRWSRWTEVWYVLWLIAGLVAAVWLGVRE